MSPKKNVLTYIAIAFAGVFSAQCAMAGPALPDIVSQKGITVGGAIGGAGGKNAAWGGSISLTEADSFLQSNGKCAFNIAYDMENPGAATVSPFKNQLIAAGSLVSEQSGLQLNAGENRQILTQAYLPPGSYDLQLKLDAGGSVTESNEGNNLVAIKVRLDGKCETPKPAPKPDIVSQKGITIGGAIGGAGGKFSAWGGTIFLGAADAFLKSNGKCAFNVSYDMENIGTAAAVPAFLNRIYSDADLVSQQTGLSLNTGEIKQINTQAYLAPGSHVVRLTLDADNNIVESNEANNTQMVKVVLDANCSSTSTQPGTHPAGVK